ncbi:MAG TPA: GntR family transcriptional regulator [Streptosporangiaceae bacterium]
MVIDPEADRPIYRQLADLIRDQIKRGELPPGQRIPVEVDYMLQYDISRDSVRRAIAILRGEGLIITERRGSYVRSPADRSVVPVKRGRITARIPTEPERRKLRLGEGVPILVIEREGRDAEILPGDRTVILIGPD